MIKLNTTTQKYELIINGKVVCRSNSKQYVEMNAAKRGYSVDSDENNIPEMPKTEFSVEERFDFIHKFVGMVARKVVPSLILSGSGGIGKTHSVLAALESNGKREETLEQDGHYVVIKGFSTPKAMYRSLWENNGTIIIFDDCDSVFKDPVGSNILKGALESSNKRIITWGAEFSEREELPNKFEFTGQVIFISNLPQTKMPQSLLSRSLRIDLSLSLDETVDRISHVLNEVNAKKEDKSAVLKFIRKHASKATDLNIRSALTILKLRQQFGDDFERISLYNFCA